MSETKQVQEYEAMDEILEYLIENKTDRPIHAETIWKDLYPKQDEEVVYFILKKMMNTVDQIFVTHVRSSDYNNFDVLFEANAITKRYLYDQGGFTKRYHDEEKERAEKAKNSLLNLQKLESEIDIIKFQKGLGKKLTIWGFIVAVISVVLSVYTSNSSKTDNSKIDSLNVRIKSIEKELLEIKKYQNKTAINSR